MMATPLETEALLASIGLLPILEAKSRLTKGALEEAAAWSKVTKRRVLRFLASDAWDAAADFPELDYPEVLRLVSEGQTPAQTQALFAAVPDRELATDLGLLAEHVTAWANGAIPRSPPNPITNMQDEEPGPAPLADFRRAWNVAIRPRVVLDDLCDGSLIDDQVIILAQLYPEILKDMLSALDEGIATMVSRRGKRWQPGPTKSALIETLRQQSSLDPDLAATLQTAYAQDPGEKPVPPPKGGRSAPSGGSGSDSESTPGTQASAG